MPYGKGENLHRDLDHSSGPSSAFFIGPHGEASRVPAKKGDPQGCGRDEAVGKETVQVDIMGHCYQEYK